MKIYLLRHGKAEDGFGKPDGSRKLTAEGIELLKKSLPGIENRVGVIDLILTSPLVRAVETASIVAEHLKKTETMEETDLLARPNCERAILEKLNGLADVESVVCVGHMPLLAELARYMIPEDDRTDTSVKKGGLVKIVFKGDAVPHGGVLKWIAAPKELRGES